MGWTSRGRRAIVALGASLALHALLVGWVARRPISPPAPAEVIVTRAPSVDFEVALPPAKAPAMAQLRDRKAHRLAGHKGHATEDSAAAAQTSTEEASLAHPAAGLDEGRRLELKAVLVPEGGSSEVLAGGRTVRAGDPVVAVTRAQRDRAEAREAGQRVMGWMEDYAAAHRAEIGLVAPYYEDMALALRAASEHPPLVSVPSAGLGAIAKTWVEQSERYGATGNPYTPEESPGNPDRLDIPGLLRAPSAASALVTDLPVSGLVAIVEITQQADGRLVQSILLSSSGSHAFDAYVLGAVPDALGRLPSPPDGGLGLHPDRLRSVWSFQGRTTFEHRWKEIHWGEDGWYLLATAPLWLLSGRFDEVTGEGGFADLRHPKMLCEIKLLRVY